MNAALVNPHLNNFFGLGNETFKDPLKPLSFYRVRFSSFSGDIAARKRFAYNKMSLSAGPSFYYYWNNLDKNSGRILSYPSDVGLDSTNVYTSKLYAGGHLAFRFNTIANDLLPVKGVGWHTVLTSLASTTGTGLPVTKFTSDLSLYAPLSSNRQFTFVLHTGGGHIFSDNYEYFQALTLGANNYLRGYRKNRFSGSTMAYASTELRVRLLKLQSRILPGDFGLVGFNDLGRVWIKSESSGLWHSSQGGGIYFTPFNLVMLSAVVARSEEETLFNLSVGTRLNITF
jgi:outer membrane protein assembly factor BamA